MRLTRWLRHLAAPLALPALLSGCYAYTAYAPDRPVAGMQLEVTLNDRGRVAMEHNVGPEILSITGTVAMATDTTFTLRVMQTVGIDHAQQKWAGEPVTLRPEYARNIRERRFSSGRTVMFAGTVTATVVAFVVTRSIFGGFLGLGGGPGGPGGGDQDN